MGWCGLLKLESCGVGACIVLDKGGCHGFGKSTLARSVRVVEVEVVQWEIELILTKGAKMEPCSSGLRC